MLHRAVRWSFVALRDLLKRNPTLRTLIHDSGNREIFTDLKWHERMLADSPRVSAYRQAVAHAVKEGDIVIDLGTGSGILAFFAAARGAKRVYAIDHSAFISVAREIATRNGFDNISFVEQNSRDFVPPEAADILLHEQIGNTLFGENMIENLLDLKKRALKPSGRILPAEFDLYIEPVSMKPQYRMPFIWEIGDTGVDFSFLRDHEPLRQYMPASYPHRVLKNFEVDGLFCEPQPVLSIDLNRITSERDVPTKFDLSRKVVRNGTLDGFCIFFRVRFDGTTMLDTAPTSPQTSWVNTLVRTPARRLEAGQLIGYHLVLEPVTDYRQWTVRVA
jgi:protein arginine N-methyltransferase 1